MASANIYSIADPPPIEYIPNNQGGQDIECLNYVFNRKTLGRKIAYMFVQVAMLQLA